MESTLFDRNLLFSKHFNQQQPKKGTTSFHVRHVSDVRVRPDPSPSFIENKGARFQGPLHVNSPTYEKKIPQLKPREREREKSMSLVSNNCPKNSKDPKVKHFTLRRQSKNQIHSCSPSPLLSPCGKDTIVAAATVLQEKNMYHEHSNCKQSNNISNQQDPSNLLALNNQLNSSRKDKKRVKLIRVERPVRARPGNFVEQDYVSVDNQVVIMNPAIEQEIFKHYLETDKQTFNFEQLVLSKSYGKSEQDSSFSLSNSRSNSDAITPLKQSDIEPKLQIATKDSCNTLTGLTTNSTSRYKGSQGVISGADDKENRGLNELSEWSKESESATNTMSELKPAKHSHTKSCLKEIQINPGKFLQAKARTKETNIALAHALDNILSSMNKDNKSQMAKPIKKRNLSLHCFND